jgi:hypothetical protein
MDFDGAQLKLTRATYTALFFGFARHDPDSALKTNRMTFALHDIKFDMHACSLQPAVDNLTVQNRMQCLLDLRALDLRDKRMPSGINAMQCFELYDVATRDNLTAQNQPFKITYDIPCDFTCHRGIGRKPFHKVDLDVSVSAAWTKPPAHNNAAADNAATVTFFHHFDTHTFAPFTFCSSGLWCEPITPIKTRLYYLQKKNRLNLTGGNKNSLPAGYSSRY